MRSIWNGTISFGLVGIPVKLMSATENHSISFRQIHIQDGGRIRYRKVCELDEQEVTSAETVKAYEDADGTVIPVTDEDLASLPLNTAKTIEIVGFVPAAAIDPLQLDTAYYLAVNGVPAAKPYVLLREALRRSEKVAVAKFALRGRERLGMLRVAGDVIAMHGLLWPDEIRDAEGVAPESDIKVRDAELDLADTLMNTLGEADLDTLHDDYREAVEELVSAKAAGEAVPEQEPDGAGGKVLDLMAALENSVRAAQKAHGDDGAAGEAGGGGADIHPIESGGSGKVQPHGGRPAPKPSGTKKSTSTSKQESKQETPKASSSTKRAEKKPAAKKTARTATKKAPSKKTSAGKAAAGKSEAGGGRSSTRKPAAPNRKRS